MQSLSLTPGGNVLDGHIFRTLRESIPLTRTEAAKKLGVSTSTIRRIENRNEVNISDLYLLMEGHGELSFKMIDKKTGLASSIPIT